MGVNRESVGVQGKKHNFTAEVWEKTIEVWESTAEV